MTCRIRSRALEIARIRATCSFYTFAMSEPDKFHAVVELIRKEDARYDRRAYAFVRDGLERTVGELEKKNRERLRKSRHVSGPELLQGLRAHALDQFGPLAQTVLNDWGVCRCADFGEIVFNLIEHGMFSKTDADKRKDFADIYDFSDTFVKPFLPQRPSTTSSTMASKPA
jgi:uncharacterized repeat protein (TIGR04138 family)